MSEYTKGPWMTTEQGYGVFSVRDGLCDKQIVVTAWNPKTRTPENRANARLIAAAPELLEALKTIADRLTVGPRHSSHLKSVQAIQAVAKAAIAKAESK